MCITNSVIIFGQRFNIFFDCIGIIIKRGIKQIIVDNITPVLDPINFTKNIDLEIKNDPKLMF
mgnify:CR=1 FL=1